MSSKHLDERTEAVLALPQKDKLRRFSKLGSLLSPKEHTALWAKIAE